MPSGPGTTTTVAFELTGEFRGFVRDAHSKRRLVLHRDGEDLLLKVPKKIRRRLAAEIQTGQEIRACGVEEKDKLTGANVRRIATRVSPARESDAARSSQSPAAAAATAAAPLAPIRVCAKRHCWQNGGRELWDALENALAAHGLTGAIRLKAVKCLDRCKAAPNADWEECAFRRCAPADAAPIVARVAAEIALATPPKAGR